MNLATLDISTNEATTYILPACSCERGVLRDGKNKTKHFYHIQLSHLDYTKLNSVLFDSLLTKKFSHVLVDLFRFLLLHPVTCRWNVLDLEVRDPFCRISCHRYGQSRVLGAPDDATRYLHFVASRWIFRACTCDKSLIIRFFKIRTPQYITTKFQNKDSYTITEKNQHFGGSNHLHGL